MTTRATGTQMQSLEQIVTHLFMRCYSIVDLDTALEHCRRTVPDPSGRGILTFASALNRRSPVSRLPPELFGAVLEWLCITERFRALFVCKAWREAALSIPTVWSSVFLGDEPIASVPGVLSTILRWSGTSDLSLSIRIDKDNWEEGCACITAHITRCVFLDVAVDDFPTEAIGGIARGITNALCHPAPRLRTFKFWDVYGYFNMQDSDEDAPALLFAGQSPRLRLVKFCGDMEQLCPCEGLRTVSRFLLHTVRAGTPGLLERAFSVFPNLQAISVNICGGGALKSVQSVPASLALFRATHASGKMTLPLTRSLESLRLPTHVRLHAQYTFPPGGRETKDIFKRMAEGVSSHKMSIFPGRVDDRTTDVAFSEAVDDDPWMRCIYGLPRSDIPLGPAFETLTRLYIAESCFCDDTGLPEAPALTLLSITLGTSTGERESIFLLPPTPRYVLRCPNLRELELVRGLGGGLDFAGTEGSSAYLSPQLVHEFITRHLFFGAPQLDVLRLKGARLVETWVEEVASLLTVVKEIHWTVADPRLPDPVDIMYWDIDLNDD